MSLERNELAGRAGGSAGEGPQEEAEAGPGEESEDDPDPDPQAARFKMANRARQCPMLLWAFMYLLIGLKPRLF